MPARRSAVRRIGSDGEMEQHEHENSVDESADASGVASLSQTVTSTIADGLAHTVAHWKVLLLGQGISFVLAIAGATNEVLALAFGYSLIAIFGGIVVRRDTKNDRNNRDVTREEQESFRDHNGATQGGEAYDLGGHPDDDDLTLESESSKKMQKRRNAVEMRSDIRRSSNRSRGTRQYPIFWGMFIIHAKWYYYFSVAFIEAQAYYLIFLAFRYTSFTFVYVSDALAIPSAMIFTKLIMKRSYLWTHLIGGAICVAGIVVNTASDMSLKDGVEHASSSDHIKGDIFAVFGAILLGLDDVLSEIIVSDYGTVNEMLFMKGLFGALISFVQLGLLERDNVSALFGKETSSCTLTWRMALFTAHVFTRSLDVAGEMKFLHISEAALLNLLLLTSDFYAAIFDVITVGLELKPLFFLAFFLIAIGVIIYEAGPSPAAKHPNSTPVDIEFHQRAKEHGVDVDFTVVTEHAGNLSPNVNGKIT